MKNATKFSIIPPLTISSLNFVPSFWFVCPAVSGGVWAAFIFGGVDELGDEPDPGAEQLPFVLVGAELWYIMESPAEKIKSAHRSWVPRSTRQTPHQIKIRLKITINNISHLACAVTVFFLRNVKEALISCVDKQTKDIRPSSDCWFYYSCHSSEFFRVLACASSWH